MLHIRSNILTDTYTNFSFLWFWLQSSELNSTTKVLEKTKITIMYPPWGVMKTEIFSAKNKDNIVHSTPYNRETIFSQWGLTKKGIKLSTWSFDIIYYLKPYISKYQKNLYPNGDWKEKKNSTCTKYPFVLFPYNISYLKWRRIWNFFSHM